MDLTSGSYSDCYFEATRMVVNDFVFRRLSPAQQAVAKKVRADVDKEFDPSATRPLRLPFWRNKQVAFLALEARPKMSVVCNTDDGR
jgi:hypothetical protein